MKSLLRIINRILLGLLAFFLLYLLMAFILALIPVNSGYQHNEEGIEAFIISNGIHAGIALPVHYDTTDWCNLFDMSNYGAGKYRYVLFGWGEKEFYINTPTWSDLRFSTAVAALFWPTESAMHVTFYHNKPRETDFVKRVFLTNEQVQLLESDVRKTFRYSANGKVIFISTHTSKSGNNHYYEAVPKYHLFFTCNNWTNQMLKHAGIKTAVWAPFDRSILFHFD